MISSRMPEEPRSAPPAGDDRLDSWKEIAAYLRKGVRTVQRWERTENLPVRRDGQDRPSSVFAYKSDLDAWWHAQTRRTPPEPEVEASPAVAPAAHRPWLIPVIAATSFAGLLVLVWKLLPPAP